MKERKIWPARTERQGVSAGEFGQAGPLERWFPVWFSVLLLFSMTIQTRTAAFIVAVLALILSLSKNARRNLRTRAGVTLAGFVVFLILCTAGSLYCDFGSNALKEIPKLLTSGSLALIVVGRGRKEHIRGLLHGFLWVCAVISLLCLDLACLGPFYNGFASLAQMLGTDTYISIATEIMTSGRFNGIYNNANLSGGLFALSMFVGTYLIMTGKNRKVRLLASIPTGIAATGFVVAVSRGAMLAFAVAALIYLIVAGKGMRLNLFFTLLSLGVGALIFGVIVSNLLLRDALVGAWASVPCGLLIWVLSEFPGRLAARALEGKALAIALSLTGVVALSLGGVIFAFTQTQPYVFTEGGYLYRGVNVTSGETYTFTGDWDKSDEISVHVYGSTREQELLTQNETYYNGPLSQAVFTVPDGVEQVLVQVRGPEGLELRSLALSDGTKIPMDYKYLPDSIVNRLQKNLFHDSSFLLRLQYDIDGWKLFLRSPLIGNGLGSTERLVASVQPYYYESLYLHNHVLQVLNETGIIGLAAFGTFMLGAAWLLLRRLRQEGDPLAAALFACWAMMNLHGLMEISFSIRMYQCAAFFLLMLAVVAYQQPLEGKRSGALGVGTVVLSLGWIVVTFALILGSQVAQDQFEKLDADEMSYSQFISELSKLDWIDCYTDLDYKANMIYAALHYGGESGVEVASRCADQLMAKQEFNACYMAASYYYLPMGELEEYFSALQTGLRQERANSKAWNNVLTLCAQSLYQLPASQMDVYMDGIASIQEQMEQANEAMLVDIALEPYNQALLEAVNTARAQGLEGQEAYNHLVIAMAQQASE